MKKGPLVKVQIGKGQYRKMYEADAIAKGYLPSKAKPQAENKMRLPPENKSIPEEPAVESAPSAAVDDFSSIRGLGPATIRALAANGITTFAQLRMLSQAGKLAYLAPRALKAIEEWRELSGEY